MTQYLVAIHHPDDYDPASEDEAMRSDIFLPFFTTRAKGTGVGLNLVRQIVIAHGWTIEVGEGPEGGAEFRLFVR